jgi:regulator of sirC expression with transglutaminase-like and TPR domain
MWDSRKEMISIDGHDALDRLVPIASGRRASARRRVAGPTALLARLFSPVIILSRVVFKKTDERAESRLFPEESSDLASRGRANPCNPPPAAHSQDSRLPRYRAPPRIRAETQGLGHGRRASRSSLDGSFTPSLQASPRTPAMSQFEGNPQFTKLLERSSCEVDLVQLMLELAADAYPKLDRVGALMEIDRMGVACADELGGTACLPLPDQLAGVSQYLYEVEGFHGDVEHYYDPENSYLNKVLERRRGIPISLGILYMAVAARAGLRVFGVNTPGHFVVGCCEAANGHCQSKRVWYVDPFNGGEVLDRDTCQRRVEEMIGESGVLCDDDFRPAASMDILARVLRNLKAAYSRQDRWQEVLGVQLRLTALLPQVPQERRDLGLVYLRVGQPSKALGVLEPYLACCGCEQAAALRPSVQVARRMVAELN